jgi:hypothetical protein
MSASTSRGPHRDSTGAVLEEVQPTGPDRGTHLTTGRRAGHPGASSERTCSSSLMKVSPLHETGGGSNCVHHRLEAKTTPPHRHRPCTRRPGRGQSSVWCPREPARSLPELPELPETNVSGSGVSQERRPRSKAHSPGPPSTRDKYVRVRKCLRDGQR